MNRPILLDDSINQAACLKWSNELSHRAWNLLNELKGVVDTNSGFRLGENIKFYTEQSKELTRFIAGTLGGFNPIVIKDV